jgi:hypothetical protein
MAQFRKSALSARQPWNSISQPYKKSNALASVNDFKRRIQASLRRCQLVAIPYNIPQSARLRIPSQAQNEL